MIIDSVAQRAADLAFRDYLEFLDEPSRSAEVRARRRLPT